MKIKYAETAFFEELVKEYKGVAKLARVLNRGYFVVSNWRVRGYVPIEEVVDVSQILGISPYVLNNKHFHYTEDWKILFAEEKLFTPEKRAFILSKPLKFKWKRNFSGS